MPTDSNNDNHRAATLVGLTLALGVPLALMSTGLLGRIIGEFAPEDSLQYVYIREAFFWSLTFLVLLVLLFGERQKLTAIGFKPPRWPTLIWALAGLVAAYLTYPLGLLLLRSVGGVLPASSVQKLLNLPAWLLCLTIVRAGFCEELLFRGYGIERMTALTHSRVVGAIAPGIIFLAAHIQGYGIKYSLVIIPSTILLTLLYLWRRDLWTNILTHILVDGVGLVTASLAQRQ